MNIRDDGMWVNTQDIPLELQIGTPKGWRHVLKHRTETFRGFAAVEEKNGLLHPEMKVNSSGAQDVIRLFLMRGLEEAIEARDSIERDHFYEEMIDSFNFLSSIFIMDPELPLEAFSQALYRGWRDEEKDVSYFFDMNHHIVMTLVHAGPLLEKLRNRSWQQNAQSTYFDGIPQLIEFAQWVGGSFCVAFNHDWEQFIQYYLSKDNVLQFRLRSMY